MAREHMLIIEEVREGFSHYVTFKTPSMVERVLTGFTWVKA